MKDLKNIDRLFQEKFRDFEQYPPKDVWKNISSVLSGKPENNKRPLWLWMSGVAAGLAVLFSLNNPFMEINTPDHNTTETNKNTIQENNSTELEIPITTNKEIISNLEKQKDITKKTLSKTVIINSNLDDTPVQNQNKIVDNSSFNTSKKTNTVATVNLSKEQRQNIKKTLTKVPFQFKNEIAQIDLIPTANSIFINKVPKPTEEIFAEQNTNTDEIIVENKNKWTIATVAAPILFNAFNTDVSSIDKTFNENSKQGQLSAAYGVQLAYQINDRFSIQTGFHKVNYGYKTYDVYVSPNSYADGNSAISYNDVISINDIKPSAPNDSGLVYQETGRKVATGNLMQVFGYFEIPIEAKYSLKKGKVGVNILSGFSALIRNTDEIYFQIDDVSNKVNKTSELNPFNFTGNIGLEIDYKVYQNVHFNVTPIFKAHANTFKNSTESFRPYAIGVYSGLNFRF